jgi:hypothetical protein
MSGDAAGMSACATSYRTEVCEKWGLNFPSRSADMLFMNQRRKPRFEADQSVWITLFGEPDIRLQARIKNVSERGIGLELQDSVAIGTALKFEVDDSLILGEVIYCREDEGSFYVGVELEQALCGLGALAKALGAFSDTPSGPQQEDPVKERRHEH